jgi:hypothetical protein
METSSSIACHVVSNEIVESMSSTPLSPRELEVVPTPTEIHIYVMYSLNLSKYCAKGKELTCSSYWEVNKIEIEIIELQLLQAILAGVKHMTMI